MAEIEQEVSTAETPGDKLKRAFEIWSVRPFELMMNSAEAREIVDCSFEFAQAALRQGYEKFEATIALAIATLTPRSQLSPERIAHILAGAVRGFKQIAATPRRDASTHPRAPAPIAWRSTIGTDSRKIKCPPCIS